MRGSTFAYGLSHASLRHCPRRHARRDAARLSPKTRQPHARPAHLRLRRGRQDRRLASRLRSLRERERSSGRAGDAATRSRTSARRASATSRPTRRSKRATRRWPSRSATTRLDTAAAVSFEAMVKACIDHKSNSPPAATTSRSISFRTTSPRAAWTWAEAAQRGDELADDRSGERARALLALSGAAPAMVSEMFFSRVRQTARYQPAVRRLATLCVRSHMKHRIYSTAPEAEETSHGRYEQGCRAPQSAAADTERLRQQRHPRHFRPRSPRCLPIPSRSTSRPRTSTGTSAVRISATTICCSTSRAISSSP